MATIHEAMDDYRAEFPGREPISEKDVLHFQDWLQDRVDKKLNQVAITKDNPQQEKVQKYGK